MVNVVAVTVPFDICQVIILEYNIVFVIYAFVIYNA